LVRFRHTRWSWRLRLLDGSWRSSRSAAPTVWYQMCLLPRTLQKAKIAMGRGLQFAHCPGGYPNHLENLATSLADRGGRPETSSATSFFNCRQAEKTSATIWLREDSRILESFHVGNRRGRSFRALGVQSLQLGGQVIPLRIALSLLTQAEFSRSMALRSGASARAWRSRRR